MVVVDSGPIIALAVVGQVKLLGELYGSVLVPAAVVHEVAVAGAGRPGARELLEAEWAIRATARLPLEPLLAEELGAGEAEVLTLAVQEGARLVVLDDRRARRVAEIAYGLRVHGTAALLVEAKRRGLLPAVRPLLEAMRGHGYFISARLLERASREAGE
ncbi:MAG TPA: DUF3368 domain-containing protein [Polyangia bacterium]